MAMSSLLWVLLTIGSSVAAEESSNSVPAVEQFDLAEVIYEKQKDCDSILGSAVVTALDKGDDYEFPVPNQRYFQCKQDLDEKKIKYITTYLGGVQLHPTSFTIKLRNKKSYTLATPNSLPIGKETSFDLQQELCVTNDLCLAIADLKVNTEEDESEKKRSVARCLDFLEKLKVLYMEDPKISEVVLEKRIGGLPATCTNGEVVFTLPKNAINRKKENSEGLDRTKTDSSAVENNGENKTPVGYSSVSVNTKLNTDENVKYSEKGQQEKTEEVAQPWEEDKGDSGVASQVKSPANQLFHEGCGKNCEVDSSSKKFGNASPLQRQDIEMNNQVGNTLEESKTDTSILDKVGQIDDSLVKHQETINKHELPVMRKRGKKRTRKDDEKESSEVVSYRVKVVKKNVEGKVVNIQATGEIKKTETGSSSPNLPDLPSANYGLKPDNDMEHLLEASEKVDDIHRKQHQESLEENIVLMENDCNELLEFGENMMKYKMLSSIVEFENHYNDCIHKLNDLKKLYIQEHQLDFRPHQNIFPLTLPSGVQKLISLPSNLMSTDFVSDEKSSNSNKFDLSEIFNGKKQLKKEDLKAREPFDDPAFIPNFEFLESLQREPPLEESSTLSKVASILHINGGHGPKEVV